MTKSPMFFYQHREFLTLKSRNISQYNSLVGGIIWRKTLGCSGNIKGIISIFILIYHVVDNVLRMFENHINLSKDWFYLLILGLIIFYIIYRILNRWLKNRKPKIILTALSTIILTPLIYNLVILTIVAIFFYEYHPKREFDKTSWEENINDRHEMFSNIIESDTLIGRKK